MGGKLHTNEKKCIESGSTPHSQKNESRRLSVSNLPLGISTFEIFLIRMIIT